MSAGIGDKPDGLRGHNVKIEMGFDARTDAEMNVLQERQRFWEELAEDARKSRCGKLYYYLLVLWNFFVRILSPLIHFVIPPMAALLAMFSFIQRYDGDIVGALNTSLLIGLLLAFAMYLISALSLYLNSTLDSRFTNSRVFIMASGKVHWFPAVVFLLEVIVLFALIIAIVVLQSECLKEQRFCSYVMNFLKGYNGA